MFIPDRLVTGLDYVFEMLWLLDLSVMDKPGWLAPYRREPIRTFAGLDEISQIKRLRGNRKDGTYYKTYFPSKSAMRVRSLGSWHDATKWASNSNLTA